MESDIKQTFTVNVYDNGQAEIFNQDKEDKKKEKIIVENNLYAPLTIVVKKIQEEDHKGYEIQIYDRTRKKDLANSYMVTPTERLEITDES